MADKYIRQGATGNGSGSDWTNAYPALIGGSSYIRGDTYYIADGDYPGPSFFVTPESGTTRIIIKKATVADHGTNTGWNNTYGDGVALFSNTSGNAPVVFTTGYWTFDGQVGGGPGSWTTGHGFKVQRSAPGAACLTMYRDGAPIYGLIWKHIEVEGDHGNDAGASGQNNDGMGFQYGGDFLVSHCYIHDVGRTIFQMRNLTNVTIEYCYTGPFESTAAEHSEIASIDINSEGNVLPNNITFRHCIFTYLAGTGGIIMHGNNLSVYGCVFFNNGGQSLGNGAVGTWTRGVLTNARIYNNTFLNLGGYRAFGIWEQGSDTGQAYNNLFYNCPAGDVTKIIHDYNHYISVSDMPSETNRSTGTGNPFADYQNLDFRLQAATTGGANLGAPYNVDPLGNTRTTWTRGAYQFTGSAPPSVPATPGPVDGATGVEPRSVTLRWGSSGANDYNVFFGTSNPPPVISLAQTSDSYSFTILSEGTTYYWRIVARNAVGSSNGPTWSFTTFNPLPVIDVSPAIFKTNAAILGTNVNFSASVSNIGNPGTTLSGSASTSAPFSLVSGSPYSILSGETKDVVLKYTPSLGAAQTGVVNFTGGGGASRPITGFGVTLQAGLTFVGDSGTIALPFEDDGSNHIFQATDSQGYIEDSGRAYYGFNTGATGGDYTIVINVKAEAPAQNSFWVDVDTEPTDPDKIWDILTLTAGFQDRTVGWRGSGTFDSPEFPNKVFTLTGGDHILIIRGREPSAYIGQITITPVAPPPVDSIVPNIISVTVTP